MIAVMVGVHYVADRFIAYTLHLFDDIGKAVGEFVVDNNDTFAGNSYQHVSTGLIPIEAGQNIQTLFTCQWMDLKSLQLFRSQCWSLLGAGETKGSDT